MMHLFGSIAVFLTIAMFISRQSMLGFPSAIFWAIFGAYSYTLSVATWDIYYFVSIASLLGMTTFSMFAAYGLREKKDVGTDEDEYIDEKGGDKEDEEDKPEGTFESEMSKWGNRSQGLRQHAAKRAESRRRWGVFR